MCPTTVSVCYHCSTLSHMVVVVGIGVHMQCTNCTPPQPGNHAAKRTKKQKLAVHKSRGAQSVAPG
eukprot:4476752-Amphidinium_carterae.1